ncbi:hypothetical protein V9T40_004568 [Parthenolecanium corni]|uniref:Uncharacterized protein n=1 Tax=Parthenolecanium corni TaxID=536013 RepID=A0AAN9YB45_9HEMI
MTNLNYIFNVHSPVHIFVQLSQFSSSCFIFRPVVSIFGWMAQLIIVWLSQFSAGCLNHRLDISIFGWNSNFSSSCLNFCLVVSFLIVRQAVSIFGWTSHFSSSCLIFLLVVSIVQLSKIETAGRKMREPDEK